MQPQPTHLYKIIDMALQGPSGLLRKSDSLTAVVERSEDDDSGSPLSPDSDYEADTEPFRCTVAAADFGAASRDNDEEGDTFKGSLTQRMDEYEEEQTRQLEPASTQSQSDELKDALQELAWRRDEVKDQQILLDQAEVRISELVQMNKELHFRAEDKKKETAKRFKRMVQQHEKILKLTESKVAQLREINAGLIKTRPRESERAGRFPPPVPPIPGGRAVSPVGARTPQSNRKKGKPESSSKKKSAVKSNSGTLSRKKTSKKSEDSLPAPPPSPTKEEWEAQDSGNEEEAPKSPTLQDQETQEAELESFNSQSSEEPDEESDSQETIAGDEDLAVQYLTVRSLRTCRRKLRRLFRNPPPDSRGIRFCHLWQPLWKNVREIRRGDNRWTYKPNNGIGASVWKYCPPGVGHHFNTEKEALKAIIDEIKEFEPDKWDGTMEEMARPFIEETEGRRGRARSRVGGKDEVGSKRSVTQKTPMSKKKKMKRLKSHKQLEEETRAKETEAANKEARTGEKSTSGSDNYVHVDSATDDDDDVVQMRQQSRPCKNLWSDQERYPEADACPDGPDTVDADVGPDARDVCQDGEVAYSQNTLRGAEDILNFSHTAVTVPDPKDVPVVDLTAGGAGGDDRAPGQSSDGDGPTGGSLDAPISHLHPRQEGPASPERCGPGEVSAMSKLTTVKKDNRKRATPMAQLQPLAIGGELSGSVCLVGTEEGLKELIRMRKGSAVAPTKKSRTTDAVITPEKSNASSSLDSTKKLPKYHLSQSPFDDEMGLVHLKKARTPVGNTKILRGLKFLLSGTPAKTADAIVSMGGSIVSNMFQIHEDDLKERHIFFISEPSCRRRLKYVYAVSAGLPLLHYRWIDELRETIERAPAGSSFSVFDQDLLASARLPTGLSLRSRNYRLQDPRRFWVQKMPLRGVVVAVCASEHEQEADWKHVLEAAGATVVSARGDLSRCKAVLVDALLLPPHVLSAPHAVMKVLGHIRREYPEVQTVDLSWAAQCIVRKKRLPFDSEPRFLVDRKGPVYALKIQRTAHGTDIGVRYEAGDIVRVGVEGKGDRCARILSLEISGKKRTATIEVLEKYGDRGLIDCGDSTTLTIDEGQLRDHLVLLSGKEFDAVDEKYGVSTLPRTVYRQLARKREK